MPPLSLSVPEIHKQVVNSMRVQTQRVNREGDTNRGPPQASSERARKRMGTREAPPAKHAPHQEQRSGTENRGRTRVIKANVCPKTRHTHKINHRRLPTLQNTKHTTLPLVHPQSLHAIQKSHKRVESGKSTREDPLLQHASHRRQGHGKEYRCRLRVTLNVRDRHHTRFTYKKRITRRQLQHSLEQPKETTTDNAHMVLFLSVSIPGYLAVAALYVRNPRSTQLSFVILYPHTYNQHGKSFSSDEDGDGPVVQSPRVISKNLNGLQSNNRYTNFLKHINTQHNTTQRIAAVLTQEHNLKAIDREKHQQTAHHYRILALISYAPSEEERGGQVFMNTRLNTGILKVFELEYLRDKTIRARILNVLKPHYS